MFEEIIKKGKRLVAYGLSAALIFNAVQDNYMSVFAGIQDGTAQALEYNGTCQFPDYVKVSGGDVSYSDVSPGEYACQTNGVDAGTHILFNNEGETTELVISPKELEVAWTGENEFFYSGEAISVPGASVDSGVYGENVNLQVSVSDGDQIYAVDNVVSAGDYTVTAYIESVTGGQEKVENYSLKNGQYTFTIKQAQNEFTQEVSCGDVIFGELPEPIGKAKFGDIVYRYFDAEGKALEAAPYQIGDYSVKAYVEATDSFTALVSSEIKFSIVYGSLPDGTQVDNALNFEGDQLNDSGYYTDDVTVTPKEGYVLCDEKGVTLELQEITVTATSRPYKFYVKNDNAVLPAPASTDAVAKPDGKVIELEKDILIDRFAPTFGEMKVTNSNGDELLNPNECYWTNSGAVISFEIEETFEEGQTQSERTVTVTYEKNGSTESKVLEAVNGLYTAEISKDDLTVDPVKFTFNVTDEAGNQSNKTVQVAKDSDLPVVSDITLLAEVDGNTNWLNKAELYDSSKEEKDIVEFKLDKVVSGIKEISYQVVSSGDSVVCEEVLAASDTLAIGTYVYDSESNTYRFMIPEWVEGAEQTITIHVTDYAQNTSKAEKTFSVDVTLPESTIYVEFESDVENDGLLGEAVELISNIRDKLIGRTTVSYKLYVKDTLSGIDTLEITYSVSGGYAEDHAKFDRQDGIATVNGVEGYTVFAGSFEVDAGEQVTVSDLSIVSVTDNAGNVLSGDSDILIKVAENVYVDAVSPVLTSVTVEGKRNNGKVADDLTKSDTNKLYYYQEAPKVKITIAEDNLDLAEYPMVQVMDVSSNDIIPESDLNIWSDVSNGVYEYSVQLPDVENEEKEYRVIVSYTDASENELTSKNLNIEKGIYTSPVLVVDGVAPEVKFAGYYSDSDGTIEITDIPYYAGDEYAYFNQDNVYLKLQIKEHSFRSTEKNDYSLNMLAHWLDETDDADRKEKLESYLVDENNWKVDKENSDIHYILIPISDVTDARYDISVNYTDLAGNSQENPVIDKVVYDVEKPIIEVTYDQTVAQKISAALSKVFWFFKDEMTATITVTDKTAGAYFFEVQGESVENQIADNYETLGFTLDYKEDQKGNLDVSGSIKSIKYGQSNEMTTITVKIPAQYRGGITILTKDKASNEAVSQKKEENKPVEIVVDNLPPVLNAITYTKPVSIVELPDMSIIENVQAYDDYYLYYDGKEDVIITLELQEINFFEGVNAENQEEYFEELVQVDIYRSDVLTADRNTWEKVNGETPVELTWSKESDDGYKLTFAVEEEGNYYYTLTCADYSKNAMVSSGDATSYDVSKIEGGKYTSPVFTIDSSAPVLESIKYNAPQQIVDPETKETVTEQTTVYDGYNLYYDDSINVNFEIREANWFAEMEDEQEVYFKDLLQVKLYKASELIDTTSTGWKEVEGVEVNWKRTDKDYYQLSFTIPADQENHTGDGHYYYTITAKDYSENILAASEAEESVKGYKTEKINSGTYTSPVLTIDTTKPQVEVQYYDVNQAVDFAQNVHEYYQGGSATIKLTVTEHNFRPSDAIISMTAVDVNGKKDQVKSVIDANAFIQKNYEELKVNVDNARWTQNGDVYTATIVLNSPEIDANYTFGISYKDMANQDADKYYYNGAEEAKSTAIQGDTFTLDSVAPVITVIDNDDASDMTYKPENTSDWAKFLNYATFGYFWKQKIVVTVVAHDDISGVNTISYEAYLTDNDAVTKKADVAAATVKAANKAEGDNTTRYITFWLSPDFKGDVIANAVDFADNTCNHETLKGVVLESASQHQADGEHVSISVTTPASRVIDGVAYYNSDVSVVFRYADTYSGLNFISYSLAGSGRYEKSYMIDNQDLVYKDEIGGIVEAGKNNSNNVPIYSEYVDNAGYSGSAEQTLNIDITAPVISVEYDENEPRNEKYYNKVRTATVTITERNFREEDVVFTITNTDGSMPAISGWSHSAGNGVSDATTHTCTVTFNADGDYTFTVGFQDMAGNVAGYNRVDEFTIDLTVPEVTVQYDNNEYLNSYYYDDYRTATIRIMEHNFDPADINVMITAENDGAAVTIPSVSSWSRSGDLNTATIYYEKDAEYTFDIAFMDMAGNEISDYQQEHFVVDTIAPELEIKDIKNYTAHNGKVQPTITYSDVNRDVESFVVTLDGYKNGVIDPGYISADVHNGVEIVLQDLEHIRSNDDLYTLRASVMDMAGNTSEAEVIYSINRFGSIFILDEATEKFVDDYYHMQEQDLVVREINVDTITSAEVTYSVNGQVITMSEDDYSVVSTGTRDTWKENVYTLKKTNFETEGEYSVTITSKDEAKNAMSNKTYSSNEDGKALISFVIDKTNPYCIVTGVEDGKQYNEEIRTVTIDARDNIYLDTLQVILDGTEVATYDAEQLQEASGVVTLDIGSSNKKQTLEIIAKDKAGNYSENKTITFLITTNLFYQYINNKVAVGGSVAGVGVLAVAGGVASVVIKGGAAGATASGAAGAGTAAAGLIGGFFALFKKRKKDEDEE